MTIKNFRFELLNRDKATSARTGKIVTNHGDIDTPAFVPVGTQATVKSLTPEELSALGIQLFFVNTYHAYLRPGVDVITQFGGLHGFMNWNKPIITDSGGFQVFSLGRKRYVNIAISESAVLDREKFTRKVSRKVGALEQLYPDDYRPVGELVRIDDDGVTFTSHWDGSTHRFTPEVSVSIQHALGADMIIAFDECPPYPTTHEYAQKALDRTHAWAVQSLAAHRKQRSYQALYGVIQGSVYRDLREYSAEFICEQKFDGIAVGGVAVGESKQEMRNVLDWVIPKCPENLPRHLLGVGEIDDIFDVVERGVDTFDCVQPTRLARMGRLFIHRGFSGSNRRNVFEIDITQKVHAKSTDPIDTVCRCYTCSHFSRAYIHHLFRVRELLGYRLATIHNLAFIHELVQAIRSAISQNRFLEMKKDWVYNKE